MDASEMTLGQRMKLARTRAGFTAKQLAALIGVSARTIARWEKGQTEPGADDVKAVAEATGTTANWLMTGKEAAGPPPDSVLEQFLRSPEGQRAFDIPGAVHFLRHRIDVRGYRVDVGFYRVALFAYESGAQPDEAARAAEFTRRHQRDESE